MKKTFSRVTLGALLSLMLVMGAAAAASCADLDEILTKGVVRVGIFTQDPPKQFLDPSTGKLVGLEVDIAAAFADKLGVKLDLIPAEWDALIPGLLADKWDVIIANMARLPSRATTVDFTLAFENTDGIAVAVRKNETKYAKMEDFNKKGIKIGTGRGNAGERAAIQICPNATLVPFASPQLAIQALVSGQVEGVPEDYTALMGFAQKNNRIKVVGGDKLKAPFTTGFAVKPGNFRLWLWANIFLVDFKNSGKYLETYEKWFPGVGITEKSFDLR